MREEYTEPEQITDELADAIKKVKAYCEQHENYEDCMRCVLGDGIHKCSCSSPYLFRIRK